MRRSRGLLEGLARVLLGVIFLFRAGKMLINGREAMEQLMNAGIPWVPFLFVVALTFLLLGSLGLALGYRSKSAALVLLILSLAELLFINPPWYGGDIQIFLLRCSVMGGLLLVILHGPGPWSFDAQSMVPVRRKRS